MSDTLEGYPTDWFCDSPQKEFICGICLDVLKDPQQCKNGHLFCSNCISTALESHQECPACKTYLTISRLSSNLLAKNLIDQMHVKCNLDQKHGSSEEEAEFYCKWTGPLHEKAAHLSQCPVQMVRCPLYDLKKCQNCSGLVPRNGLEKHLFHLCPKENSEIVCSLVNELNTLKDKQIGNGFAVLKVGAETYRGDVKHGLKNGFGTAKYVYDDDDDDCLDDIESYAGHWKDGEKSGFGTAVYFCGDVYFGAWENNERQGKGTLKTANGKEYCGDFNKHGVFHGQGTEILADGTKYAGDFAWGDRHGQGSLTQPNGDVFTGSFSRGVQNWNGTIAYANGDLCIRSFDYDFNDPKRLEMRFVNGDVFLGTKSLGMVYDGEMRYAFGCVVRGKFDENFSSVGVMKKYFSVDSIKFVLEMFRIV